jgi:Zyg-11 family protein
MIAHRLIGTIELEILEKVVEVTLKAMETFPNHQQIQALALSILRMDLILQDVTFNRYKCMQLVVNSVVCVEDKNMKEMATRICSKISKYLTTDEKNILTLKTDLMENLLQTVRQRAEYVPYNDSLFENSLKTISNLTESSPEICKLFIEKEGLEFCSLILIVILSTDIELFSKLRFYLFRNFRRIWIDIL